MCYNQIGDISTLDGTSLKLVDKFTYLGSSVSSTEKDFDTRLTKAWTAIDRLSIIWKSDLTDEMKCSFFQAEVVSILLYGCITWTLTKRQKKKLNGNYTRMLRAILNKSWRQHPTRHQLYGHLPPFTKTIQVRRTRHAGHCWRSKDELISDVLQWTPHMAKQKQDYQLEHTYSSYVRIRDVALKTYQKRWMIGRNGERRSGISVLAARHDENDDILLNGFKLAKERSRRYPAQTIMNYTEDIALLGNSPTQAKSLLHSLERAAGGIGLHVYSDKKEYLYFEKRGDISTLKGGPLKPVDKFTYLGNSDSSTENIVNTQLAKAWTAIY